jgi:hypothetical protein
MRVLLTNHLPLDGSSSGEITCDLARGLLTAGHQVRCLVVDDARHGSEEFGSRVRRVVCRQGAAGADLPFDFPCFTPHSRSRQTFSALSDSDLSKYREELRLSLDDEVDEFNPHIVHCQQVWIFGHLALEAGVPYVLSTDGAELPTLSADDRYARLAQEAAENAGRLIVPDEILRERMLTQFGELDGRVLTLDLDATSDHARQLWIDNLVAVYRQVLTDRFGVAPV